MTISEYMIVLEIGQRVFVSIGTFAMGAAALSALGTWREQIRGQGQYNAARDISALLGKLRIRFKRYRNEVIPLYHFPKDLRELETFNHVQAMKSYASIYIEREDELLSLWNEIEEKLIEAEAIFDETKTKEIRKSIWELIEELRNAWHEYIEELRGEENWTLANLESRFKNKQILERKPDMTDEFSIKITEAITDARKYFEKYVK